jgi:acetyltransferase-like isoleucine patch superfamily enzyme
LGKYSKIKHKSHICVGKTLLIGDYVEINALSKRGVVIGNNVSIHRFSILECTGVIRNPGSGISIGNHVGISQNCFIQARGQVEIGNNVIMGPGVKIFSENHIYADLDIPIKNQGEMRLDVLIEEDVWIGANAIILGGVNIGKGSVVAAGAVVNKNVLPYSVVGGIPAKCIKMRK